MKLYSPPSPLYSHQVPAYVLDSLKEVVTDPSQGVALHQYTRGFGHPRLVSYSSLLPLKKSSSILPCLFPISCAVLSATAISLP